MYLLKVPRKSFTNDTGGGDKWDYALLIVVPATKKAWFARAVFHGSTANRPFRGYTRFCHANIRLPRYISIGKRPECAHRRLQMFVRNRRFMDTCLYETSVRLHERWTNWHSMKRNIVLHLWAIMRVIVRLFLGE